jgi:hypothetical protein
MRAREGQGTGVGSPEGVAGAANGGGSFPIPWTRVLLLIAALGLPVGESG